jgi:hypothetical protein
MADNISKSDDPSANDHKPQVRSPSPQPFLRMRPKHFFSNKFDMEIVEDYSKADAAGVPEGKRNWLGRLMELNLLLLILLIGVPVLVYCILSSAA